MKQKEKTEKNYAYEVLENYDGDMLEDNVLVGYILEHPRDKVFERRLKEKAPNVYLFLQKFLARRKTMDT